MTIPRRSTVSLLAALVASTLVATGAVGQDEDEAGLCRLIEFDQLNSLSDVRYDEIPFWDLDDNCKYLATSDPDGFHYARLHLDGLIPYDDWRDGALDPVDIEVGGYPAFTASDDDPRGWLNTQVLVDLGEPSLRVTLIADEGADPDQMATTVRLAEIAVSNLDIAAPEATTPPVEATTAVAAIALPEVDGISWQGSIEGYGAEITELAESGLNLPFEVLLEELGTDISQLGFHIANATDASTGDPTGNILAVRVAGVEPSRLQPAVTTWLGTLVGGDGLTSRPAEIGGRDVLVFSLDPQTEAALFVGSDTAYVVTLPEPLLVALLATLP